MFQVIFFTDPVDEYLMQYQMDYEDKRFQNVSKEGLKLGKDSKDKELKESLKELTKRWKGALASENMDDMKISNRLADKHIKVWLECKYGAEHAITNSFRCQQAGVYERQEDIWLWWILSFRKELGKVQSFGS